MTRALERLQRSIANHDKEADAYVKKINDITDALLRPPPKKPKKTVEITDYRRLIERLAYALDTEYILRKSPAGRAAEELIWAWYRGAVTIEYPSK